MSTQPTGSLNHWDERFIRIANEVAGWSKDPGTKVGAVLVNDRRIISQGYNGFPAGISDSLERYMDRDTKLAYTVHAEVNAILNAAKNGATTALSKLYVTFPPCVSCASAVIQAGVTEVVCPHLSTAPERWIDSFTRGHNMLLEAGVQTTTYQPA